MELVAEPCSSVRVAHAEGPFWSGSRLGWVDIPTGTLWHASYEGGALTDARSYEVGRPLGAAVPAEGGWLLAAGAGFYRLAEDGAVTRLTEDLADASVIRMNDGKVDPRGRFFAGTMAYDESPGVASFYAYDGAVREVLDGVTISNGLGWSPDHRTMYYIDTPTRRVDAFDYDEETGAVRNRRPLFEVDGDPDGMTVDDEGLLWVAVWGGGEVRRYEPSGKLAARVRVAATNTTSCCFGGPDGGTLFITTSRQDLTPEQERAEPDAGRVFHVSPGVTGPPATTFAGTLP